MLMLFSIFTMLLFSCIGVDIAHFVSANIELQNVADASAMAGCFKLTWQSTAAQRTAAINEAQTMASKCYADFYSPNGIAIPAASVASVITSNNGGTDNTIQVTVNPPIAFLIAPFMLGAQGGSIAGATATAEQLPILSVPAPPWFMKIDNGTQNGPTGCTVAKNGYDSGNFPFTPDSPPTTFPSTKYVTFIDDQPCKSNSVLPTQWPTYWVYYGISNLATVMPNPPGISSAIKCLGICTQTSGTCTAVNPIIINGSQVNANHGSMSSAVSNPENMSQPKNMTETGWSGNPDGSSVTTVLPITTGAANDVVGVYAVKLFSDMVPNTYKNGQGVYGEFQVEFTGPANNVPGVTVYAPTAGVFNNVGSTVAQLIK